MHYVITGSLGNISKPVVEKLTAAGHSVTVITHNPARAAEIEALGAKAAVGSIEDPAFVTSAFAGAEVAYLMIPPNWGVSDWYAYQQGVANNYVNALKANHIKNVVLLSSIGADVRKGVGPVDGAGYLEEQLGTIEGLNAKFLRPSYFFTNLFSMIPMIKNAGIMGANYGSTEEKLVLVHPNDIAEVAAQELMDLNFKGLSVRYISSDERHPSEIAAVLGAAIDKAGIPWVVFTDEQSLGGMLQAGLSQTIAEGYTTMGAALRNGIMQADYWKNRPDSFGKVKLEDFAKDFVFGFNA